MKALAVIPARGGSQRIKDKNIRPFLGRPIIEYAIEKAKAAGIFNRIVVSTDSEMIRDVAINAGASVPFMRPAHLADHFTGTHAVTAHTVAALRELGEQYDYVCCIYATSPLLQSEALIEGVNRLQESGCAHVVSVTAFDFPVQRGLYEQNGWVAPIDSSMMAKRSQDLRECWHDAAQFYWSTIQALETQVPLWGDKTQAVVLPKMHVQDIDTLEDWQLAECKYRMLNAGALA